MTLPNELLENPSEGRARVLTKDYQALLLQQESVKACGEQWQVRGKSLGAGVYELHLERLNPIVEIKERI